MEDILNVDRQLLPIGSTPLHLAANNNDTKTLTQLLHSYSDLSAIIDLLDGHGRTPLVVALQNGRLEAAVVLIRSGASLETNFVSNQTVQDVLASEPYLPIVENLVQLNANVTLESAIVARLLHPLSYSDDVHNSLASLEKVLSLCPSQVDAKDHLGCTALHYAALRGNLNIVLLLLKFSANCKVANTSGSTPLHLACGKGHLKIVRALVSNTSDTEVLLNMQDTNGRTPLHVAMYSKQLPVVRYLVHEFKSIFDPFLVDNQGYIISTLLFTMRFSLGIQLEHTQLLPCLTVEEATWMLHECVAQESLKGVVSALEQKAIVNSFDLMQQTPLLLASKLGNVEICKALVEGGANPIVYDNTKKTPVYYACRRDQIAVFEYLLSLPEINLQLFFLTYDHPLTTEQLDILVIYFKEHPSSKRPANWQHWLSLAASNPSISVQAFSSFAEECCPTDWIKRLVHNEDSEIESVSVDPSLEAEVTSYPLLPALQKPYFGEGRSNYIRCWSPPEPMRDKMKVMKPFTFTQDVPTDAMFKYFNKPGKREFQSQKPQQRSLLYSAAYYKNVKVFESVLRKALYQFPDCLDSLFIGKGGWLSEIRNLLEVIGEHFELFEASFDVLEITEYVKERFVDTCKSPPVEFRLERAILLYLLSGSIKYKYQGLRSTSVLREPFSFWPLWYINLRCTWYFNFLGRSGHVSISSNEEREQLATLLLDNCSTSDLLPLGAESADTLTLDPIFLVTAVENNCVWGVQLLLRHGASPLACHGEKFALVKAIRRCRLPIIDALLESQSHDLSNSHMTDTLLPDICEALLVLASRDEPEAIRKLLESFNLRDSETLWCSRFGPRLLFLLLGSHSYDSVELGKSLTDSAASFLCKALLHPIESLSIFSEFLVNVVPSQRTHPRFLRHFTHLLTVCQQLCVLRCICTSCTFHYLCSMGMLDLVSFFLNHLSPSDVTFLINSCDSNGRSPLFYAACSCNYELIQLLTDSGFNTTVGSEPPLIGYLASLAFPEKSNIYLSKHIRLPYYGTFFELLPHRFVLPSHSDSVQAQKAIIGILLQDIEEVLKTHGSVLVLLLARTLKFKVAECVLPRILSAHDKDSSLVSFLTPQDSVNYIRDALVLSLTSTESKEAIALFDDLLVKLSHVCNLDSVCLVILFAARKGFWGICREFVRRSSWPFDTNDMRFTDMLHESAKQGKVEIIEIVYSRVRSTDHWLHGVTCDLISTAFKKNQIKVVNFLLHQEGVSLSDVLTSVAKFGNKESFVVVVSHVETTQPDVLEQHLESMLITASGYNKKDLLELVIPMFLSSDLATSNKDKQYLLSSTILRSSTKHGICELAMNSLDSLSDELIQRLSQSSFFHEILYWSCYWGMASVLERLPFTSSQLLHRLTPSDCTPWECALVNGHVGKIAYLNNSPSLMEARDVSLVEGNPMGFKVDEVYTGSFHFHMLYNLTSPNPDTTSYRYCSPSPLTDCYPITPRAELEFLGSYAGEYFIYIDSHLLDSNDPEIFEMVLDFLKDTDLLDHYIKKEFIQQFYSRLVKSGSVRNVKTLLKHGVDILSGEDLKRKENTDSLLHNAVLSKNHEMVDLILKLLDEKAPEVCFQLNSQGECPLYLAFALGATTVLQNSLLLKVASKLIDITSDLKDSLWAGEALMARGWFHSMMLANEKTEQAKESQQLPTNISFNIREVPLKYLLHHAVSHKNYSLVQSLLNASGHLLLNTVDVGAHSLLDPVVSRSIDECCFTKESFWLKQGNLSSILSKLNKTCDNELSFVNFQPLYTIQIAETFNSACSLGRFKLVHEILTQRSRNETLRVTLDDTALENGFASALATGNYNIAAYLGLECGLSLNCQAHPFLENVSQLAKLIFTCSSYYTLLDKFFKSVCRSRNKLPLAAVWLAHDWTELESQYVIKNLGATSYAPSNPWTLTLSGKDRVFREVTVTVDWDSFSESLLHTPLPQSAQSKHRCTPLLVEATIFSPAILGQVCGYSGSDRGFNPLSFYPQLEQVSTLIVTAEAWPNSPSFKLHGDQGILSLTYNPSDSTFIFPVQDSSDVYYDMLPSPINDSGIQSSFESSTTSSNVGQLEELVACFEKRLKKALWKGSKVSIQFDDEFVHAKDSVSFDSVCDNFTYALYDCIEVVKLVQNPSVLYDGVYSQTNHHDSLPRIESMSGKPPLLSRLEVHLRSPDRYYDHSTPVSVSMQSGTVNIELVVGHQKWRNEDSLEQDVTDDCEQDKSMYESLFEELRQCVLEAEAEATLASVKTKLIKKVIPNLRRSLKTGVLDEDFVSLVFQDKTGVMCTLHDLCRLADIKQLAKMADFVNQLVKLLQVFSYKPKSLRNTFKSGLKVVLSQSEATGFVDRGGHSLLTLSTSDLQRNTRKENMYGVFKLIIESLSKTSRRPLTIETFAPGIPAPFGCFLDYKKSRGYMFPAKNVKGLIVLQLVDYNGGILTALPTVQCVLNVQMKSPSSKVTLASSSTEPHPRTATNNLLVHLKAEGVFEIQWTPLEVGLYTISIHLNQIPIHDSPLKAFSSDRAMEGSRQSIAGDPLVFIASHSNQTCICPHPPPVELTNRVPILPQCLKALEPLLEANETNSLAIGEEIPFEYELSWLQSKSLVTTQSQNDRGSPLHHISMCSNEGGHSQWFKIHTNNDPIFISPDDKKTANRKALQKSMKVSTTVLSDGLTRISLECTKATTFRVLVSCSRCQAVMEMHWLDHIDRTPARCYVSPGPFSVGMSTTKFVTKTEGRQNERENFDL